MFLNRLKKKEKVAFLELAHHVARSDNDFSESQQSIIGKYCMEMQIDDIKYNDKKFDLDKTLSKVKDSKSQNIVLLELMALIYTDDVVHDEERKILDVMSKKYKMKKSLSIVYGEWAKSILALHIQGDALIEL